ncbi:Hypothetical protein ADU72_1256 [Pediococcus damnosus]|uniref:Uncharacterized protein n=1 Tax=Pediococcus damnosus TaxID=51663 RepID=A0AAC9B2K0_9LACO|nr:hypothetical protein [Pediococcus damnosus]AMV60615.1 Hypothetical protein ADU69_0954 [Pediococcus damnosus]AMV62926.1 Hypothetical protein ADU70_1442 [Pediococcus damnosus]AMV64930.1 Hypothetical protein ADU71_1032 [Pediococcus damnosus]AMV67189.1 Hypothetical protein ADU72_1256 [Pediococcus damnosus]AMV69206.1 Hypothetical protein ADU73_0800 [Pediococcus damnosus]
MKYENKTKTDNQVLKTIQPDKSMEAGMRLLAQLKKAEKGSFHSLEEVRHKLF